MSAGGFFRWLFNFGERRTRPAPEKVQRWLRSNTFHYTQFTDLKRLVEKKKEQRLRISLCLPTLNEEKTIGKAVVMFKSELMTRYPLIDELVVVDSGSQDRTREIAASFGADVHLAADILPSEGNRRGKGENLWKAVHQLTGDIIVYVDADISNIRPHFAYGLLGPLIERPEVKYVKAFYDRPLISKDGARGPGGGRVTEILVRPLFSLFFPELSALIQPLSGEYAARREALERISFPIGYGVETAHLLDVYHTWGLEAFAQTDLGLRVHRNQSIEALGRMSFGILQTFFHRIEKYDLARDIETLNHLHRQFRYKEQEYEQVETEIREEERPPMINIPEYREKHGRQV